MKNIDTFSSLHPGISLLYFTLVLFLCVFFLHPLCLLISLGSALLYACRLSARGASRPGFFCMLPLLLGTALLNPLFNHEGATVLARFPGGSALTLESAAYGAAAAAMLFAVLCWFSCYNAVITTDKFIYLFGRVIPAMSLVISMTLRFVPRFRAQFRAVSAAQRCMGREISDGGTLRRAKNALTILSVMVTWSLENAVETADSMKSRGYGLQGRTAFSIYRFEKRDAAALLFLLLCGGYVLAGVWAGGFSWSYFPVMGGRAFHPYDASVFGVYLALCLFPVLLDLSEEWAWTRRLAGKEGEVHG